MLRDGAAVEGGYAAHGVNDVLVKAGEEPEPVFARQSVVDRSEPVVGELVSASAVIVGDLDAARLASRNGLLLQDDDFEAALDQFVGGAHAGDAAAQNDDFRWACSIATARRIRTANSNSGGYSHYV